MLSYSSRKIFTRKKLIASWGFMALIRRFDIQVNWDNELLVIDSIIEFIFKKKKKCEWFDI